MGDRARLATALVPFWEAHGHLAEGRRWLKVALAAPTDAVSPALRLRTLAGAGRLAHLHADYDEAERLQTESLALAREEADAHGIAAALCELGMVARRRRDFARSVQLIEESLARYRELGDEAGIAWALLNLGSSVGDNGDLLRSTALLTDALTHAEARGDLRSIAIAQALLGAALRVRGELDAATRSFAASLAGHAHLGDRWFVAYSLMNLAQIQASREQWEAAARLLGAAQAIGERVSSKISGVTYEEVGATISAHMDAGRFAAAWAAGHALTSIRRLPTRSPSCRRHRIRAELPSPPPHPASLTSREREVARLVARGRSDREIAEALFVSVGTVGGHVHHILQKLDLRSRHQVAQWLHTHDPHAADFDEAGDTRYPRRHAPAIAAGTTRPVPTPQKTYSIHTVDPYSL